MPVSFDRATICYQAIQRVYRNAVVAHVRRRFVEAFGNEWEQHAMKPFGHEWADMVARSEERIRTGQIMWSIDDSLDYLGVNHFVNLFDMYFDVLIPEADAPDRTRQQTKQAIVAWAKAVKDVRDPISHPISDDIGYDDSFVLIDSAQRIVRHFDERTAGELKALKDALGGAVREPLDGYLPPREEIGGEFVGRRNELAALDDWLADPSRRRWALMGDGGKGKSAIAFEFAQNVKDQGRAPFQFVIWLSAKRKRFVEGAIEDIAQPNFSDLPSALRWILSRIGWEAKPSENLEQLVLNLLGAFPTLLVVDDVDSLEEEDELAVEYFTVEVPGKTKDTKILFTSRIRLTGFGATTTTVSGFTDEEARAFIDTRIRQFGLDPAVFAPSVREKIITITDGSPLFIEDLLRFAASGVGVGETLKAWEGKDGEEVRRYALRREFDFLSERAREVLVASAVGNWPVSFAEIRELTGLGEETIREAIAELQKLFLVPTPRLIEEVERFDLNLNTRLLVREVTRGSELHRRIEAASHAVSGNTFASRRQREAVQAYARQAVFLSRQGDHENAEKTLESGLGEFPNAPSLVSQMAWVYRQWKPTRRVADAREWYQRAAQLKLKHVQSYGQWAEMETNEQEWQKGIEAAQAGIDNVGTVPELLFWRGNARGRLGRALTFELQPKAIDLLLEGEADLRSAIMDPSALHTPYERFMNSRAYRALALNLEVQLGLVRADPMRNQHLVRRLASVLNSWRSEHPDDPFAASEDGRLRSRFGLTDTSGST